VLGLATGALGFAVVILSGGAQLVGLFQLGVALIGAGRGMFIIGSIALVMALADKHHVGLFVGLWGVMQALAQGFGTVGGGLARDLAQAWTGSVLLGYTAVYGASLALIGLALLLFLALRLDRLIANGAARSPWSGLQDIPGDQILY
jgi:MFS transporter, BCD family, chlorophyll transporter